MYFNRKTATLSFAVFTLGMLAMSVQVIFIREFLSIFEGNEMVIGLCLGIWMLLTGLGAFLGSLWKWEEHITSVSAILMAIIGAMPMGMLWGLAWLKSVMAPAGASLGPDDLILLLFLVLGIFCLLSGILFPLLASIMSLVKIPNPAQMTYALDSAGSIAGGILFSLVFIFVLNTTQSLIIIALMSIPAAAGLGLVWGKKATAAWAILIIIASILAFTLPESSKRINGLLYSGQQVIESINTPFGKLTITKTDEQLNLFENSFPVSLAGDMILNEESVHYAMLYHPDPHQVLMISGGLSGAVAEVLQYPGVQLDYLEFNPWVLGLVEKYTRLESDERLKVYIRDPRLHLREKDSRYDVILLNLPDPHSASSNRFFTVEFFTLLGKRMNPGGILSLSVTAAGNYMNETSRALHSVVYATLSEVFEQVLIIPGHRDYYLATDGVLNPSLWTNYERLNMNNDFVNPGYINERLLENRRTRIMENLVENAPHNSDMRPFVYLHLVRQWTRQFNVAEWVIPAAIATLIIMAFLLAGPLSLGLFTSGFTVSSLQFILLIWLQVMYGNVYQMTGLVFAAFMLGLASGSYCWRRLIPWLTFKGFITIQSALGILSVLVSLLMMIIPSNSLSWFVILLIFILVAFTGLLMGMQFGLAAQLRQSSIIKTSGESFSADLLGAAAGIIIVSIYLVPHLGMPVTSYALAGLNAIAMVVCYIKRG